MEDFLMAEKPTYKELKQRIQELEKEIVQHKKVKNALTLFSHSIEGSNDTIAIGNTENNIIYVNEVFARMFGYSRKELKGKELAFIYPDDQKPLLEKAFKTTMEGGWTGELIGKKKDGTLIPVSVSSSRVLDDQGNVIGYMANHRDITQQKQTAEALRKSEEKYRTLFENSKDAIYISTRSGKFIAFNQSFLDLFGYTKNEMRTINAIDLYIDPNDRVTFLHEVEKKGSVKSHEVKLQTKDGAEIYVLNSTTVRKAHDGSILGYQGIIRDITKQKLAEEALRESEEKWRSVFEQSGDPIAITTRNGEFVDANQSFMDLFGYTKSNVIELYAHPEDRIRFTKEIEEKGSVKDYELMLRKTNGEEIIALCSSTLRRAPDGSILGYQSIVRDITQKRKTLEALRKSEAQKKAILDASIDRIRLVDRDMRIIWSNQTTVRSLNVDPEDLVGEFCYQVFVSRDTPCPECPTIKALKSGNIEHGILYKPRSKFFKEETHWDNYAVPIKNESGDIESLIQITRNITEQMRAEKALRKSEEKYRTILESINEGYYEVDLAGNITFFNDATCAILGYSRDELMDTKKLKYTDEKTSKKTYKAFNNVYKTGKPKSLFDVKIIRKDGKNRTIEASASLMKDSGDHPIGFRGIIRDVTERKQAEERLRKREVELESLNKQLIATNKALSVLAKNLDITQKQSEKRVIQRIRKYIIPIIERLQKGKNIKRHKADLDLLGDYVKNLVSGLASDMHIDLSLSASELRVASLIRNGIPSKKIAKQLFISLPTVTTHRRNIRRKLDLQNSGINLTAYMKSEFDQK